MSRYEVQLRVGDQPTTNKVYVAYNAPAITHVTPLAGPSIGGINITVRGINFGITRPTVTIGGRNCPVLQWHHFELVCRLPTNQGTGLKVAVTVNGQVSNQAEEFLFEYDPPVLFSMYPTEGNTAGGEIITLYVVGACVCEVSGVRCPCLCLCLCLCTFDSRCCVEHTSIAFWR